MSKWSAEQEQKEREHFEKELEKTPTAEIDTPELADNPTAYSTEEERSEAQVKALLEERDAYAARGDSEQVKQVEDSLKAAGYRKSDQKETTAAPHPGVEKRG